VLAAEIGDHAGIEIDASLYPNITALYRVGFRGVEARVGDRRFRLTIYEALHDAGSPRFSANYEEEVQIELNGEWRPILVKANLPWEAADTVEECVRAGLRHIDEA
jgi:hypothetical protein